MLGLGITTFRQTRRCRPRTVRWLSGALAGNGDELLHLLASNGIWGNFDFSSRHGITERGILDFCFGRHVEDARERHLEVGLPLLSPNFLDQLVQARRDCTSSQEVYFELYFEDELDMSNVGGKKRKVGRRWRLTFSDLPRFKIEYMPPDDRYYGELTCRSNYMTGIMVPTYNFDEPTDSEGSI
ncbi:hypothetical protein AAVH_15714 [Aphelenchoides avenae]|nr:hypothetical protein AAVH_15714 [Aphelenchus avenae]